MEGVCEEKGRRADAFRRTPIEYTARLSCRGP